MFHVKHLPILDSPFPVIHSASGKESVTVKVLVIPFGDSGELLRNMGNRACFVPVIQEVCLPNHFGNLCVVLACHCVPFRGVRCLPHQ